MESRLFADEDYFNWSEPPQRRRRRTTEGASPARRSADEDSIYAERGASVLEYEPELLDEPESWDRPTAVHSHFDEMMAQWNTAYGAGAGRDLERADERAFDLSDPGQQGASQGRAAHGADHRSR